MSTKKVKAIENAVEQQTISAPKAKNVLKNTKVDNQQNTKDSKTKVYTPFAQYAVEYVNGNVQGTKAEYDKLKMVEKYKAVTDLFVDLFVTVTTAENYRENGNTELCAVQVGQAKEILTSVYFLCGHRPPKKENGENRPLFPMGDDYFKADFARLGELFAGVIEYMHANNKKIKDMRERIYKAMLLFLGRMVEGKNADRLTADDIAKAEKQANKIRAEQAQETKKKNAENGKKGGKKGDNDGENSTDENAENDVEQPKVDYIALAALTTYAVENLDVETAEKLLNWAKENAVKF